mgnify:FL=1
MKNYYEILEVDKNASEEVIEKAYKTLAKKYHPDLQNNSDCQDKMRQINEAYEILSNDFKRREYDEKIKKQSVSIEEYNKIIQENNRLKQDLQKVTSTNNISNLNQIDSLQFARRYYSKIRKKSEQPQIQYNRKKINISFEKIKRLIIYILILFGIGILLATIPVSRNFFINLYNNNTAIKLIVNIIIGTFSRGF